MSETNPFFHRGPIRDPLYFFGRGSEIRFVTELLRARQSVSLSAPRRFGKTSLLFYLAHPEIAVDYGLGPDSTCWAYLDGGMLDGLDVEWFYGAIDRALGGEVDAISYPQFVEKMRTLAAQKLRLIVALDEFELIAANPRFGPALFNHLRGLAAQFPLQFVTASCAPLGQLTFAHRETLSSPFFNIFAPVRLPLMTEAEATHLLITLSARYGRPFSPETVEFILDEVGPQPLFLQVAAYRTFTFAQEGNLSSQARATIRTQILADLEQHLLYAWHSLDPEAQYSLATLPLYDSPVRSVVFERLIAAGLVNENSESGYPGRVLESFVRQQQVEGVWQKGPFLLDLRLGLAAAYGQALHLTPTEFAAFRLFLDRSGQIITTEEIESALWPDEIAPDPERARGVIKKLRAALGPAGEAIANRRGQGWMLVLE